MTQYDRAVADYGEALKLDPNFVAAYVNRANAYVRTENYARALADYDEAAKLNGAVGILMNRGVVREKMGQDGPAIADLDQVLSRNPDTPLALYYRGLAKHNMNDPSGAADIARARELDPNVDK
jgi:tetratricopeptide (TPR) repeat protein